MPTQRIRRRPEEARASILHTAEQLLMAGRDTVGDAVGVSTSKNAREATEADDLDRLIDQLDALDL